MSALALHAEIERVDASTERLAFAQGTKGAKLGAALTRQDSKNAAHRLLAGVPSWSGY